MTQRQVLNADQASSSIRKISEYVENIGSAAVKFKNTIDEAHQKSDLTFLDTIGKAMGQIEQNVRNLSANCEDITVALNRYIAEFAEYENDTTGLYN